MTRKKKEGRSHYFQKFAEIRVTEGLFELKPKTENQTKALKLLKEEGYSAEAVGGRASHIRLHSRCK